MSGFQKGQSGNPGGRPRVVAEVRALAQANGVEAFQRLVALTRSADERVALAACIAVLDRAYGRPAQMIEVSPAEDAIAERLQRARLHVIDAKH